MTISAAKRAFIQTLIENDFLFASFEERNEHTIKITFRGDNLKEIDILVTILEAGEDSILTSVSCYDLFNFEDKYAAGLVACNKANDDSVVKFYIDEDNDTVVRSTLLFNGYAIDAEFNPGIVLTQALQIKLAVDDEYPNFAKAKFA